MVFQAELTQSPTALLPDFCPNPCFYTRIWTKTEQLLSKSMFLYPHLDKNWGFLLRLLAELSNLGKQVFRRNLAVDE